MNLVLFWVNRWGKWKRTVSSWVGERELCRPRRLLTSWTWKIAKKKDKALHFQKEVRVCLLLSVHLCIYLFCSLYWRVRLYCSSDKRIRKGEHRRIQSCWGSSGPHASDSEPFWNSKLVTNEIQISGGNLAQSKTFYLNHSDVKARSM